MTALKKLDLIPESEYLAGEQASPLKHEYLGGFVYAMAGGTNAHNMIATNIVSTLHARLRGSPCRAFNSDAKIRVRLAGHTRFYYPDASVACRLNPPSDSFQDDPTVIVEVVSNSTRRVDEGEKREAYLTIATLSVLLLVEQDIPAVVAFRRQHQDFARETYQGLDTAVPLSEIGAMQPLADVYEAIEFRPGE